MEYGMFKRLLSACLVLSLAAALSGALGGCASRKQVEFTPLKGERAESQWEIRLVDGDNDTPLTGAMAVSIAAPDEGRLYVMLSMGQTLGKCVLSGGETFCEPSVPGVAPLLQKAATPMARILQASSSQENTGMFRAGISTPHALQGRGWRCDVDGDWLVYREDRAKWTLRLRRIK